MPTDFTPFASLGGGILIGIASVLLMANFGRIMGATGILAGVLMPDSRADWGWWASLLAGMVTAQLVYWVATGREVVVQVPVSTTAMIVGIVVAKLVRSRAQITAAA